MIYSLYLGLDFLSKFFKFYWKKFYFYYFFLQIGVFIINCKSMGVYKFIRLGKLVKI